MILRTLLTLSLSMGAVISHASETESIKLSVQPMLAGDQIQKISEVKNTGLYEIVTDHGIFYSDKLGSILISNGIAIDTKSKENLTEKTQSSLGAFDFKKLPLNDAIKVVRGDGSRKIVTFEDVNCSYCKRLMTELGKINNVTVYTFLVPILAADSKSKAESIWCSKDQSVLWQRYMSGLQTNIEKKECDTPIDRNLALFNKLRLRGTPAILFESNTKAPGFISADQIESKL